MEQIVVTGYGIKAPGVENVQQYKEMLMNGNCALEIVAGIGPNESDLVCGIIHNDYHMINNNNYKRYPRVARLAIAATDDALLMSGIQGKETDGLRTSIIMGTSIGGMTEIEQYAAISNNKSFKDFPIHGASAGNPHSLSSAVASHVGANGLVLTNSTGCTAGIDAILMAKLLLESNQTDRCIIGGSDSPLSRGCIYSFSKMRALSRQLDIQAAGAPFSKDKDGFVLAEGAAVLVLERESTALLRGARMYGTIDQIYSNNDGKSIFGSDLTGDTMTRTLQMAVGHKRPTYMNSQALGLLSNDTIDAIAYKNVFGNEVPITSIKGMIGHALGASGVMQVISSLLSIEHSFIPPTLKSTGKGYDLPLVQETIYCDVDLVAITSHGYGGNNTCMLISK